MVQHISVKRTGITVGTVFVLLHATWLLAVYTGVANRLVSIVAAMHFLAFQYATLQFDPVWAVMGLAIAFLSGCVIGVIVAGVWNLVGTRL